MRVKYELAPLGLDILPLQQTIRAWAEGHIESVQSARPEYDAQFGERRHA